MKYLIIFALFAISCNQQPQPQIPVQGSINYTINDTLNIISAGEYYFSIPSVACQQGGFQVTQPNVLHRSLMIATFSDNYSTGTVLNDSINPACSFTRSLEIGVYETPNKTYFSYTLANFKSWVKITDNSNGLISGQFHLKALTLVSQLPGDTVNVIGTFKDFNIVEL
jgi:hypothetical protein